MASVVVTFTSAVCLVMIAGAHATELRSCGIGRGVVCMPTVCSLSKCLIFKNATCVDDKCGCEGRFFNYMAKDKTYQDVTKMCTSGNVVLNFANFSDSAMRPNDESAPQPRPFVRFFYHFNNLVTEILADLVGHLRLAAEKHPVQANIDLAQKASTTLENLKNMTEEHRAMWKAIMGLKDSDIVHDEDSVHDNRDEDEDGKTGKKFTAAHKAKITQALTDILKRNPALMAQAQAAMKGVRDEDEDAKSSQAYYAKAGEAIDGAIKQSIALLKSKAAAKGAHDEDGDEDTKTTGKKFTAAHKAKVTEALNRVFKQHPELMAQAQAAMKGVRDEDGATDASLKLAKAHADVLQDMLSDEEYIPVGGSGKPGVLSDRGFFSSLIQTVLPVVQNLLGF